MAFLSFGCVGPFIPEGHFQLCAGSQAFLLRSMEYMCGQVDLVIMGSQGLTVALQCVGDLPRSGSNHVS